MGFGAWRRWVRRAFMAWPPIMCAIIVTSFSAAYGAWGLMSFGAAAILAWMWAGLKYGGDR